MGNFSHKVRAESVQILVIDSYAQVHKAGCAHQHKADRVEAKVFDGATLVRETETIYKDDFYYVAPCARKA